MNKIFVLALLLAMVATSSASLVIFEAGDYIICMDKKMEISKIGDLDFWPMLAGFDKINSREEYEQNLYSLEIKDVLSGSQDGTEAGVLGRATVIELHNSGDTKSMMNDFIFIPVPIGNTTIGKVMMINTTLYNGTFEIGGNERTPHYVRFNVDDTTQCEIYNSNTNEHDFKEFLGGLDVIPKSKIVETMPKLLSTSAAK